MPVFEALGAGGPSVDSLWLEVSDDFHERVELAKTRALPAAGEAARARQLHECERNRCRLRGCADRAAAYAELEERWRCMRSPLEDLADPGPEAS